MLGAEAYLFTCAPSPARKTSDAIVVAARVLPAYNRAGGYDRVDARVDVEYPTIGLGALLAKGGHDAGQLRGETTSPAGAALLRAQIPTKKAVFQLNDDGVDGDETAGNGYYSGTLTGLGIVDGHYRLRFIFDFTADGCTTRREATQSFFVHTTIDKPHSNVQLRAATVLAAGRRRIDAQFTPGRRFGNVLGPGRSSPVTCQPTVACKVVNDTLRDVGAGVYAFAVDVVPNTGTILVTAFDTSFDVALPCDTCTALKAVTLTSRTAHEHATVEGLVRLAAPAPKSASMGAVVFLVSSDPRLATVPASVVVPAGETSVHFAVSVQHLVGNRVRHVRIRASYGGNTVEASLGVLSEDHTGPPKSQPSLPPGAHTHYPSVTR